MTDPLGVIVLEKGEPIPIGVYQVLSGADSALGQDQLRGIEIRVEDEGGKLLGHPIKLVVEDSTCSAEGGRAAARNLAADAKLALAIGGTCSSSTAAAAPILWQAGVPSIGASSTAPALTAPDRPNELQGFVRVGPNDLRFGRAVADWAYGVERKRTAVVIHDGSSYSRAYARGFAERFKELGGMVASIESIAIDHNDVRSLLARVGESKPQILF
ncbi:MAG: ABC transporter substrate-binding protein, partial [Alphaproteobacteria bacterium]